MQVSKNRIVRFETQDVLQHCCGIGEIGGFELFEVTEKPTFSKKEPWLDEYSHKPSWWSAEDTTIAKYRYEEDLEAWEEENKSDEAEKSGTGLFVAAFIGSEECHEAYKYLCKNHTLLFQTKPRVNTRTRNEVFFCVFDHARTRKVAKLEPKETEPTTPRFPIRKGEKLPRLG